MTENLNWLTIGKNPYGNEVQENNFGVRRVEIAGGWANEDKSPIDPIKFCRALKQEDLLAAAESMSVAEISRSFKHKPSIAYIVWKTPKGKTVKADQCHTDFIEKSQDKNWLFFKSIVSKSLSEKGIRAWAEQLGWDSHLPKWNFFTNSSNDTFNRGIQIGLARYLERRKEIWTELGLIKNTDSALWRSPAEKRNIYSILKVDNPVAPQCITQKGWPVTPDEIETDNNFDPLNMLGKKQTETKENTKKKIQEFYLLWCTQKSLSVQGKQGLDLWFLWLINKGNGAIVFDSIDTPEQRFLFQNLKNKGLNYQRWIIKDEEKVKACIWWINVYANHNPKKEIKWINWTGKEPKKRQEIILSEEDEFGRVPYRSLSKISISQGMAPRRLEQNMYEGLLTIKKEFRDIDKWVAKGLDIPISELPKRLSAEQVDAVAIGKKALMNKSGIIIADETGFGKGRILAALALTGLKAGKTVVLFTENSQLFSDFYRDLLAVSEGEKLIPTLLHQKAVVIDPEGQLITKSLTGVKFKKQLDTLDWGKNEAKLILSTYAQINRGGDEQPKLDWLLSRIGESGWLLLDEAHNAAGDSNVAKNLNKLIDKSNGVIFSSATYAKTEKNLSLYEKSFPIDDLTYTLLKKSMLGDTGEMREALTTAMAKKGRFIRREHPPVPPPTPIWVDLTPEQEEYIAIFSAVWQRIFEASEGWEKALNGKASMAWLKLGAALSRSIKDFSMLMKSEALVNEIEAMVKKDQKAVIVVESTFEAALRNAMEGTEINDEDNEDIISDSETKKDSKFQKLDVLPLWKNRLVALLETVAPQEKLEGNDDFNNIARVAYEKAKQTIALLPDWDLAPLDKITRDLNSRGIDVGELSGRSTAITNNDGEWFFGPRVTLPRIELVSNFNSGKLDVLILTRAGCSGISLHAGEKFKDQRVRNLIEWNIAANPANRIQFWGRVRRKDQVIEPYFFGLALNILSERRNLAKEDLKREKLAAHVGMKNNSKEISWLTPEGELIVAEWAFERVDVARRLGVARPVNDEPTGRVDRALARSIILPESEQKGLLKRLERGLDLVKDIAWRERHDPVERKSRIVRRKWWWGHPDKTEDNINGLSGPLSMPRLDLVERVWEPMESADPQDVLSLFKEVKGDKNTVYQEGEYILKEWLATWKEESIAGVPETFNRKTVMRWIKEKLPLIKCGNGIRLSRPGTGEATWGIILDMDAPERDVYEGGASLWSLSQVGVRVWLIGEKEPLMIPLSYCYNDGQFTLTGKLGSFAWFNAKPVSNVGVSIEGNPVIAAAWGRRWNAGRPTLIRDEERGLKWVWAMPQSWTWEIMQDLTRDLIDVEHAIQFWKDNPDGILFASLPSGKTIKGNVVQGGISFQFDKQAYEEATETWLGFKQNKVMTYKKTLRDNMLERSVKWSDLRTVLYAMEGSGIFWRCQSIYESWYKITSLERVNSFDKTKVSKDIKQKSKGKKKKAY